MGFLEFSAKCLELKDLKRTGWLVRKVKEPESVAAHSFFVALLCMLYAEEERLNVQDCVSLALAHDLHESISGDICSREFEHQQEVTNAEKKRLERKAILELSEILPKGKAEKIESLGLEYLECSTKNAVFVRDMDLLEMCLQALYYKENKRTSQDLSDFFRKTERELKTSTAKRLFSRIKTSFGPIRK